MRVRDRVRAWVRRWGLGIVVAPLLVGVLGGCGNQAPTAAVTRLDGRVVVRYKPCQVGPRIERLDLLAGSGGGRTVWSATRQPGAAGSLQLAVAPSVAGYSVTDRLGADGPQPDVRYSFDARSTDGQAWGGPDVVPRRLRDGRSTVAGQDVAFASWAARPASCPHVTAVGVLAGGAAVAAVSAVLIFVVRRPLQALARRANR